MSNQTWSASGNLDDAARLALANGEDITVNTGAVLTINSDNRWSQQAAVIGNISIDAGTGGTVRIDGRDVWWVPFDNGGGGNIPALGTVGTLDVTRGGSGVAEFLGIWSALAVAPTAAGGAMPATGFAKFRRVSGTLADNDVLTFSTGATITVNSATGGQRGWLHIVGEEGSTITVPRVGTFDAVGDWFELGVTSGADDQTFQYHSPDICPAIQVETSEGSGTYEWWVCAGTTRWGQAANRVATDARGKVFGCTAAGVITIARRASNSCGYKPAANLKVRCPNVHVSNAVTTTWVTPSNSTTLATRWDFTTTSAGVLSFNKVNGNWYPSMSQAYSLAMTDCGVGDEISISENATEPVLTRCVVGLTSNVDAAPFLIASCFSGVTLTDCIGLRYEQESGDLGSTITDCDDVTITRGVFMAFGDNTAATLTRGATGTGCLTLTRVTNSVLNDVSVIGASLRLAACVNVVVNDLVFGHSVEQLTASSTNPVSAVDMSGGCSRCVVDGYGGNFAGIANIHPYNALVAIAQSYDCRVENIGSAASPYDCGSANASAGIAALGGNGSGHVIRRCYCLNARSGGFTDTNADARCTFVNVWGDGADTGLVVNSLNVLAAKGLRSTNPTTGATAVYGSHFYDTFVSTTEARLILLGNEPTASSGTKFAVSAGTAIYTSTGQVKLVNLNDAVAWEMDYFWLGITALNNAAPTFSGTNSGNHTIEFQYDTGSGWNGTWLAASGANLSGVGAINPATGIKLKVRATCNTGAATNAIINIRITATTDASSYVTQYPLPGYNLTLTGLQAGSDVVIYDAGTTTVLGSVDANAGTSWVYNYQAADTIDIGVFKAGHIPFYIRSLAIGTADASLPIAQVADRAYLN
jgi:hypothetical protein